MNKKQTKKVKNKRKQIKSFARQLIKKPEGSIGIGVHADWLEISAWAQSDGKVARQDVISAFAIEEEVKKTEAINSEAEELVSQIWYEIKSRSFELKDAYPFYLSDSEEILYIKKEVNISYIFCLLVSYYGLRDLMNQNTSKGSNLFEGLCTHVAHKYLSDSVGESGSLQFGASRDTWEKKKRPLPIAIAELIKHIGEGTSRVLETRIGKKIVADGGDGGLDIVAWRKFPDKRMGYLLFFGQCATAKKHSEYMSKLNEHQGFLETYLNIDLKPIFGFFLPHSLTISDEENKGYWNKIKMTKNIPFDRNRIALYGQEWVDEEALEFLPKWQGHIQKENSLI